MMCIEGETLPAKSLLYELHREVTLVQGKRSYRDCNYISPPQYTPLAVDVRLHDQKEKW